MAKKCCRYHQHMDGTLPLFKTYLPFRVMQGGVQSATQRQSNPEVDLTPLVEIE